MKNRVYGIILAVLFLGFSACGGGTGSTSTSSTGSSGSSDSGGSSTGDDSSSGSSDTGGSSSSASAEESFSASGTALTIDDIVTTDGSASLSAPQFVTASSSAAYYFGRFIIQDDAGYNYCGSVKFKLNKQSSTSGYFSDFSLLNLVAVNTGISTTAMVSSTTDMAVDAQYNSSTNHLEIESSTSRFVSFDLSFGSDILGDIQNAGVLFSSDFTTMVGGDDTNFFFIAQKVSSQPTVSLSDIVGNWSAIRFNVNTSSGVPSLSSTLSVAIDSPGSNIYSDFSGADSQYGSFSGITVLTDATAACYAYSFDDNGIDGGFLLSADGTLAVGYDFGTGTYFAMEP